MTTDRTKRLARLERLAQAGAKVLELTDEDMARYEHIAAVLLALAMLKGGSINEAEALQQMAEKGISEADGRRYLAMGYIAARDELMPDRTIPFDVRMKKAREAHMNDPLPTVKRQAGEVRKPGDHAPWLDAG